MTVSMTWQEWKRLEGRQVVVTLDDDPVVEAAGVLVYLDTDGEAVLYDPTTQEVRGTWPVLDVREVPRHARPDWWTGGRTAALLVITLLAVALGLCTAALVGVLR